MKPIRSRRSCVSFLSLSPVISVSSSQICPEVTVSSPARQCISVDLPEPDGPMMAVNCPRAMSTSTLSSATTRVSPVPYALVTCRALAATAVRLPPPPALGIDTAVVTVCLLVSIRPAPPPALRRQGHRGPVAPPWFPERGVGRTYISVLVSRGAHDGARMPLAGGTGPTSRRWYRRRPAPHAAGGHGSRPGRAARQTGYEAPGPASSSAGTNAESAQLRNYP